MKVFIIGTEDTKNLIYNIALELTNKDVNLDICRSFNSTLINNIPTQLEQFQYFMNEEEVVLAHKNDSLLYLSFYDKEIEGITLDDYMNSDIIPIKHIHFNDIADTHLQDKPLLVILDSKTPSDKKRDVTEFNLVYERSDNLNLPLLYFFDNEPDISDIVYEYITCNDEQKRKEILEDNL